VAVKYLRTFIALLYICPAVVGLLFLLAGHPLIALVLWAGNGVPGFFLARSLSGDDGPN